MQSPKLMTHLHSLTHSCDCGPLITSSHPGSTSLKESLHNNCIFSPRLRDLIRCSPKLLGALQTRSFHRTQNLWPEEGKRCAQAHTAQQDGPVLLLVVLGNADQRQKSEEELLPEGICDGKLGTGSLDHLCPGRDHQPDGGLSLSLHGAPWLGFCQSIPNWQIFVLQAHIPDFS